MAAPFREHAGEHVVKPVAQIVTHGLSQVSVDLSRADAGVAEQHLYDTDVDAVFQQMCSKPVTQRMRRNVLVDAERIAGLIEGAAQRLLAERRCAVAVWEEQVRMTVGCPEAAQGHKQCLRQRQNPFLVSLANDAYDHLCRINGLHGQSKDIADTQTQSKHEGTAKPVAGLPEGCNQPVPVIPGNGHRQSFAAGLADFFTREERPVDAEGAVVEESESVPARLEGAFSHPLFITQPENVLLNLLLREPVRTNSVVILQLHDRADIENMERPAPGCKGRHKSIKLMRHGGA